MPGSTSPCTAQVAIAASTALPPALRIRRPASAASGCPAATMPCLATTVGRQLVVDWADGCATNAMNATAPTSHPRILIGILPAISYVGHGFSRAARRTEALATAAPYVRRSSTERILPAMIRTCTIIFARCRGRAGSAVRRAAARPRAADRRICRGRSPGATASWRRTTSPAPPGASSSTASSRTPARRASAISDSKSPVAADTRVPHRVDDQELHGDVDPEAARRRQAVARRSGRALRAGAEGPRVSDQRLAADHDPPPAVARRRISRRQPVGRSPPGRQRGRAVGDAARRHPVLERARHRLRVLELRLRHPRPHRRQRLADEVRRLRRREHPEAAGHGVDDARAGGGAGSERWRTAIGGRTRAGRTSRCCRTARSDRWAGC